MKKINLFFISLMLLIGVSAVNCFAGTWVKDGDYWKYDDNGTFVTSDFKFIQDGYDAYYYYFDAMGHMAVGLQKIGGDYYMFDINGHPVTNSAVTVDGTTYTTKNRGKLQNVYKDLDVVSFNIAYLIQNQNMGNQTLSDIEESNAALAESKAKAALEEDLEKRGPRSSASKELSKNVVGPGQSN